MDKRVVLVGLRLEDGHMQICLNACVVQASQMRILMSRDLEPSCYFSEDTQMYPACCRPLSCLTGYALIVSLCIIRAPFVFALLIAEAHLDRLQAQHRRQYEHALSVFRGNRDSGV